MMLQPITLADERVIWVNSDHVQFIGPFYSGGGIEPLTVIQFNGTYELTHMPVNEVRLRLQRGE